MILNSKTLNRRRFLTSTAPVVGLALSGLVQLPTITYAEDLTSHTEEMRTRLLALVNGERFVAGVRQLELDDLACRVATAHAIEMAADGFISHWGRDGRKPYQRFALSGGFHATQENVASIDNLPSAEWKYVANQLEYLHVRMHGETPPNDGHRRSILAPQQTHVGFGFALTESRLRLVETYVAKYVKLAAFESRVHRKASFELSGRLLNPTNVLQLVDVCYEPPPTPADLEFLAKSKSYSLPDEYKTLRPRLAGGVLYADRHPGVIELSPGGHFRVPVKLYKSTPGVYTIVFWIRTSREKAFPATEICVEAY